MNDKLNSILDGHRVMTLATNRPDGWPQATTVGYINDGLLLYFLISRSSQKFANILADDRVAIAIGSDTSTPEQIEGLSIAANTSELRDEPYRSRMLARLSARHPGYFDPDAIDMAKSALIRATPTIIAIADFSHGLGHSEVINVGAEQTVTMTAERPNNWGLNPAH